MSITTLKNDNSGFQIVDHSVLDPPKDILNSVAADPIIDGSFRRVILRPNAMAFGTPVLDYWGADEHNFDVFCASIGLFDERLVYLEPEVSVPSVGLWFPWLGLVCQQW